MLTRFLGRSVLAGVLGLATEERGLGLAVARMEAPRSAGPAALARSATDSSV